MIIVMEKYIDPESRVNYLKFNCLDQAYTYRSWWSLQCPNNIMSIKKSIKFYRI